ncbi:copper homeostasis protein CutC [Hoeflea sp. TYP-13]|uniref:copper homeostasis protein CutC n=1 Tax=Hoeflea sp. TYP-13 TaxID=3230023 RepID=UPI0034C5EB14
MTGVALEICIDNVQSLQTAIEAGADRIELCSALALGGLTPGAGLIHLAAKASVPVYAMIRPRAGDFEFSGDEIALMCEEIRICAKAGLAGVVTGVSKDSELDAAALEKLMGAAGGLGVTLHRVFDLVEDPLRAIDIAADLGIERILTSGGATSAQAGIEQIRRYVEHANDRLAIMPGGGINASNAAEIITGTGAREIHGSFGSKRRPYAPAIRQFGFSETDYLTETDTASVRAVRNAVRGL